MSKELDKIIFEPTTHPFERLKAITARLRDPENGCPWDKEQTHESLTPYIIEEAHEVVEAIHTNPDELVKELGDVLLQVMLHSQIASETDKFDVNQVCEAVSAKLIKRHPHVFGDVSAKSSDIVLKNWEQIKQKELKPGVSILDGVPRGMPALLRAQRVSEKAARVGFEWKNFKDIKDKVFEEFKEFNEVVTDEKNVTDNVSEELGDIFFALTQVARRLNLNAEDLLQKSTDKFTRRFKAMESKLEKTISEYSLDELDNVWNQVKKEEKI
jgi:tetrapyrrole methylase family protein/MazG family protein